MRASLRSAVFLLACCGGTFAATSIVRAEPCPTDGIVAIGSSAADPVIRQIAQALPELKLMYIAGFSSCIGVNSVYNVDGTGALLPGRTLNSTARMYFKNMSASDVDDACEFSGLPDVGVSDIYGFNCPNTGSAIPQEVTDGIGPVQAMTIIGYDDTTYATNITADQANAVFGSVGAGVTSCAVASWDDPYHVLVRDETSGTQQITSRAFGLLPTEMLGRCTGAAFGSGADRILCPAAKPAWSGSSLLAYADSAATGRSSKTIGIMAYNDYAKLNVPVRPLAFAAAEQTRAYGLDRSYRSFDMQNVRDGHYAIWANMHFYALKANPKQTAIAQLVSALGTNLAVFQAQAERMVVPACAMQVQRATDMGPMSTYVPEKPCGCAFERAATGVVPAACKACSADADCSEQQCVFGFCEAR